MARFVNDVIGHRPRKVHRFGFKKQRGVFKKWVNSSEHRYTQTAACGKTLYGEIVRAVEDGAFVNLPQLSQCNACLWTHPYPNLNALGGRSLSADVVLELEMQWLWLARLGAEIEAVPHAVRGCYFTAATGHAFEPLPLCWRCRVPSWTDPRRWEWETARALVGAGEKYCYPHVCIGCRIGFRTERPRGTDATCGTCRSQPDRLQRDELRYAAPRIGSGHPGGGVER